MNDQQIINFQCNICGTFCQSPLSNLGREIPCCPVCGSTGRMRSIIHILSIELFGDSLILPDFPENMNINGIGMSDWFGYANPLAKKLAYTNTFYHQEPRLDIKSIDKSQENSYDFIISSDVFEHIEPPISIAFDNLFKLLKAGGVTVFSVPYILQGEEIVERFPDLYNYSIEKTENGQFFLNNSTKEGKVQTFDNLIFHGGEGFTVEMRLFSKKSLINSFYKAGFQKIQIYDEPVLKYGIFWKDPWSLPLSARK